MENPALGSDGLVELRGGIAGERHGVASEPMEQIMEEMSLQEVVEEGDGSEERPQKEVRDGNQRHGVEEETVRRVRG